MNRVLFVCSVYQFSRETFPVLERFRDNGFEMHVLVGWSGPEAEAYGDRCRAAGFVVHRPPPELRYGDPHATPTVDDEGVSSASMPPRSARTGFGLPLAAFRQTKRFGRDLVADIDPVLVLGAPYLSCGTFDQAIARATRAARIPYCCLPVSAYVGERNAIQARFSHLASGMVSRLNFVRNSLLGRIVARIAPSWWREQDGVAMFLWPPLIMVEAWLTGLLDPNPWQHPSDLYDVCFVESEFSRNLLVGSGYAPEKVVVVGKPLLDQVRERAGDAEYVAAMFESLRLQPGEPFVLYNVEPSYEHGYRSLKEHWQRFHEVAGALKRSGAPVVVSLHPLCNVENYRFLEDEYGFRLSEDYMIVELYPFCGVSVSFPCSTNLVAATFDKPLVIFDFLGETREDSPRAPEYRLPGARFAYTGDELYGELMSTLADVAEPAVGGPPQSAPAAQRVVDEVIVRFDLTHA